MAKQVYFVEGKKLYQCAKDASENLNINYGNLKTHLQGRNKTCAKNKYHFIYITDFLALAEITEL